MDRDSDRIPGFGFDPGYEPSPHKSQTNMPPSTSIFGLISKVNKGILKQPTKGILKNSSEKPRNEPSLMALEQKKQNAFLAAKSVVEKIQMGMWSPQTSTQEKPKKPDQVFKVPALPGFDLSSKIPKKTTPEVQPSEKIIKNLVAYDDDNDDQPKRVGSAAVYSRESALQEIDKYRGSGRNLGQVRRFTERSYNDYQQNEDRNDESYRNNPASAFNQSSVHSESGKQAFEKHSNVKSDTEQKKSGSKDSYLDNYNGYLQEIRKRRMEGDENKVSQPACDERTYSSTVYDFDHFKKYRSLDSDMTGGTMKGNKDTCNSNLDNQNDSGYQYNKHARSVTEEKNYFEYEDRGGKEHDDDDKRNENLNDATVNSYSSGRNAKNDDGDLKFRPNIKDKKREIKNTENKSGTAKKITGPNRENKDGNVYDKTHAGPDRHHGDGNMLYEDFLFGHDDTSKKSHSFDTKTASGNNNNADRYEWENRYTGVDTHNSKHKRESYERRIISHDRYSDSRRDNYRRDIEGEDETYKAYKLDVHDYTRVEDEIEDENYGSMENESEEVKDDYRKDRLKSEDEVPARNRSFVDVGTFKKARVMDEPVTERKKLKVSHPDDIRKKSVPQSRGFLCKDCNITCIDKDIFDTHLKSDTHLLVLQMKAQELFQMTETAGRQSRFEIDDIGNPLKVPVVAPPTTMITGIPTTTISSSGRNIFGESSSPVRDERSYSSPLIYRNRPSSGIQVIPPKPGGPIEARSVHGTWLILQWKHLTQIEEKMLDRYVIEYRNARETHWVRVGTTVMHELEVNGLQAGTDYLFRVYSMNGREKSEMLDSVLITTRKMKDSRSRSGSKSSSRLSRASSERTRSSWEKPKSRRGLKRGSIKNRELALARQRSQERMDQARQCSRDRIDRSTIKHDRIVRDKKKTNVEPKEPRKKLNPKKHWSDSAETTPAQYEDTRKTNIHQYENTHKTNIHQYEDTRKTNIHQYDDTCKTKIHHYVDTSKTNIRQYEDTRKTNIHQYEDTRKTNIHQYEDTRKTNTQQYEDTHETNTQQYEETRETSPQQYEDTCETNTQQYEDTHETNIHQYEDTRKTNKQHYEDTHKTSTQQYEDTRKTNKQHYEGTHKTSTQQYEDSGKTNIQQYEDINKSNIQPEEEKQSTKDDVECQLYKEFKTYDDQPLLGLDYIYEICSFKPTTPPRYVCKLCNNKGSHKIIMKHILGLPHKMEFLKQYSQELYETVSMISSKQQQVERLNYEARKAEDQLGRGSVKVLQMLNPQDNSGKVVYKDPVAVKAPAPIREKESGPAPVADTLECPSQFESLYQQSIEQGLLIDTTLIGLQHIKEHMHPKMEDEPKYSCALCKCLLPTGTILYHIVGRRHRMAYLKAHHEDVFEEVSKSRDTKQLLIVKVKELVEKYGPGELKTQVARNDRMWRHKNMSRTEENNGDNETEEVAENIVVQERPDECEPIDNGIKEEKVSAIKFDIKKSEPLSTNVQFVNVLEQANPKVKAAFDWNKENGILQSKIQNETIIKSSRKSKFIMVYSEFFKRFPVVGVHWVTEFQKPDAKVEPWYMCFMCQQKLHWKSILDHVTSNVHRLNYMKKSNYREKYNSVVNVIKTDKTKARAMIEQYSKEIADVEGPPTELQVMLELNINKEALKSVVKVKDNLRLQSSTVTSSSLETSGISTTIQPPFADSAGAEGYPANPAPDQWKPASSVTLTTATTSLLQGESSLSRNSSSGLELSPAVQQKTPAVTVHPTVSAVQTTTSTVKHTYAMFQQERKPNISESSTITSLHSFVIPPQSSLMTSSQRLPNTSVPPPVLQTQNLQYIHQMQQSASNTMPSVTVAVLSDSVSNSSVSHPTQISHQTAPLHHQTHMLNSVDQTGQIHSFKAGQPQFSQIEQVFSEQKATLMKMENQQTFPSSVSPQAFVQSYSVSSLPSMQSGVITSGQYLSSGGPQLISSQQILSGQHFATPQLNIETVPWGTFATLHNSGTAVNPGQVSSTLMKNPPPWQRSTNVFPQQLTMVGNPTMVPSTSVCQQPVQHQFHSGMQQSQIQPHEYQSQFQISGQQQQPFLNLKESFAMPNNSISVLKLSTNDQALEIKENMSVSKESAVFGVNETMCRLKSADEDYEYHSQDRQHFKTENEESNSRKDDKRQLAETDLFERNKRIKKEPYDLANKQEIPYSKDSRDRSYGDERSRFLEKRRSRSRSPFRETTRQVRVIKRSYSPREKYHDYHESNTGSRKIDNERSDRRITYERMDYRGLGEKIDGNKDFKHVNSENRSSETDRPLDAEQIDDLVKMYIEKEDDDFDELENYRDCRSMDDSNSEEMFNRDKRFSRFEERKDRYDESNLKKRQREEFINSKYEDERYESLAEQVNSNRYKQDRRNMDNFDRSMNFEKQHFISKVETDEYYADRRAIHRDDYGHDKKVSDEDMENCRHMKYEGRQYDPLDDSRSLDQVPDNRFVAQRFDLTQRDHQKGWNEHRKNQEFIEMCKKDLRKVDDDRIACLRYPQQPDDYELVGQCEDLEVKNWMEEDTLPDPSREEIFELMRKAGSKSPKRAPETDHLRGGFQGQRGSGVNKAAYSNYSKRVGGP